jgi:hypothetical protein
MPSSQFRFDAPLALAGEIAVSHSFPFWVWTFWQNCLCGMTASVAWTATFGSFSGHSERSHDASVGKAANCLVFAFLICSSRYVLPNPLVGSNSTSHHNDLIEFQSDGPLMKCASCGLILPLLLVKPQPIEGSNSEEDKLQSWQCTFCGAVYRASFDEHSSPDIRRNAFGIRKE